MKKICDGFNCPDCGLQLTTGDLICEDCKTQYCLTCHNILPASKRCSCSFDNLIKDIKESKTMSDLSVAVYRIFVNDEFEQMSGEDTDILLTALLEKSQEHNQKLPKCMFCNNGYFTLFDNKDFSSVTSSISCDNCGIGFIVGAAAPDAICGPNSILDKIGLIHKFFDKISSTVNMAKILEDKISDLESKDKKRAEAIKTLLSSLP